jgi:aminocarboxymuconate-semialdehyde decarboxylase
MTTVDVHAHHVPMAALEKASADPARYGVRVEEAAGERRFGFVGEKLSRQPQVELRDLALRLRTCAAGNVDVQLLGIWLSGTGYALPAEQGAAWSRLFNEELLAASRPHGGRFSPLASLPMQDGARAAEELDYAVRELGLKGAMIGTNVAGRNLDDPVFEPVWRKASELGVPIILHPTDNIPTERLAKYEAQNLLGNPFETLIAAASLIFGGVLDRFPELSFVLLHGGGHLPYQAGRLQRGWDMRIKGAARKAPLDYLRRFRYDTIVHHPPALRYLIDLVGSDRVLLGSDDPYDMGAGPEPAKIVHACGCAAADTAAILGGNATELFQL